MTKTNTFKTVFRAALGFAALTLGSSAWAQSGPGKGETVRVVDYPGAGNTLVRIAIAKQYCEKYGIKCVVRQMANGPIGMQTFLAGEFEIGHVGSEVVLAAIARGADIKLIAGGYGPQPFFLASRMGIEWPNKAKGYPAIIADMKGKKIGVPARGSNGELLFTAMLRDGGLTDKDVTYVAVGGPATAFPALVNSQIDAVMMFSPLDGFCEVKKACELLIDMRKGQGPKAIIAGMGTGAPHWMTADYIKKNPHVVQAFRSALKDAETFVRNPANFDEVIAITEANFKIPGEDGNQVLRATMKNSVEGFGMPVTAQALQSLIDVLVAGNQLPTPLKASDLIAP